MAVVSPVFLIRLDPWHRVFFRNLRDLLWRRRQPPLNLSSSPGLFWTDVFVGSRLPWGRFAESAIFHTAVIAVLWSTAQIWPQRPHLAPTPVFHSSDVLIYEASEYLPPLNTGIPLQPLPQKADPVYAPQPIISVPPEPDNRQQTIVTPPQVKLPTMCLCPTLSRGLVRRPQSPLRQLQPEPQTSGCPPCPRRLSPLRRM